MTYLERAMELYRKVTGKEPTDDLIAAWRQGLGSWADYSYQPAAS